MSNFYITTAIPYVNAKPHIGFALELIQADVIARAKREELVKENVLFLTGTDENSIKNVQAAEKAGVPIQEFVDENADVFKRLTKALDISNDDFIRTTEPRHIVGAKKLWQECAKDIFKKSYEGLYCTGCEQFYLEKDLVDGICPEHKTKPEAVKEENWFFKLSAYQEFLEKAFAERRIRIHPASRQREITNFIAEGLEDFSISRSNERAKNWGVDVPGDPTQKMYVWFDALANYITALGYPSTTLGASGSVLEKFWLSPETNILHVIGKGITRFHAIYWPAMLESAGVFPKNGLDILVHGYVTVNGEKISKSLGNTVDPFELVSIYGTDAVRYFLLREIPLFEDGDFTIEKFETRYNGELANGIGNLVQRATTLAEKYGLASLRLTEKEFIKKPSLGELGFVPTGVDESYYTLFFYDLRMLLSALRQRVVEMDQYIETGRVWEKSGEEQERHLANLSARLLHVAVLLKPVLPSTAKEIFKRFGVSETLTLADIKYGLKISAKKGEPLFPRLQK